MGLALQGGGVVQIAVAGLERLDAARDHAERSLRIGAVVNVYMPPIARTNLVVNWHHGSDRHAPIGRVREDPASHDVRGIGGTARDVVRSPLWTGLG